VERDPNFFSISSEISPPAAGPDANDLAAKIFRDDNTDRRKEDDNIVDILLAS